ncbi:zf-HC2 domain-containing protein [Streptomyces collinus]|uniref:zf-HC2 domain-containing protein n=1 Tax=Streptomyces collinus TaxID=42684 RepID=UPI001062CA93
MSNDATCEHVREAGAELALGVLPGRERAAALAHLDRCADCREYVGELCAVGDKLIGLLPDREPPLGFESRMAREIARDAAAHEARHAHAAGAAQRGVRVRARRARLRVASIAAVLAIAFGFASWAVGSAIEEITASPPAQVSSEPVMVGDMTTAAQGGAPAGEVYAHPGTPGWIFMTVALDGSGTPYSGKVSCILERPDGTTVRAGDFWLRDGRGAWGGSAHVNPASVSGARVTSPDGTVLAKAHLQTAHVVAPVD